MRKALFQIICLWVVQAGSYDFVVSDIDSLYPSSDDDCIHVHILSEQDDSDQIEVIEPEPEEHVQEAMTFFKFEF